ncbi:unnamed protein product [Notodromas monacha]|uniref:Uncharacterized protein n=1 Tax=Notodromas monacha TaxID=399045 RepID=A0A7R9G9H1_9CRUS|nr:unnamed protein product [Notodromas monacha]CAG0912876.1 unnamed protein product [Notodromas monacha]
MPKKPTQNPVERISLSSSVCPIICQLTAGELVLMIGNEVHVSLGLLAIAFLLDAFLLRNAGGTRGASPGKASVHFAETVDKTATSAGGGGAKANGSPANGNGHYGANGTSRSPKSKVNSGHGAKDSRPFDAYMTLNQVQRGLRKGELIEAMYSGGSCARCLMRRKTEATLVSRGFFVGDIRRSPVSVK